MRKSQKTSAELSVTQWAAMLHSVSIRYTIKKKKQGFAFN